MTRLPDRELEAYENAIAVSLRIQDRIKRIIYQIDDPDVLEDLAGIAADSAQIRRLVVGEMERRRREKRDRPGAAGQGDRDSDAGSAKGVVSSL